MSWYEITSGSDLMQGDIIPSIGVPVPATTAAEFLESDQPMIGVVELDVVVMSQSCDLENGKIDWVVVAQYSDWPTVSKDQGTSRRRQMQKQIRCGRIPYYALLRQDTTLPWSVIDFRRLFTVPLEYIEAHAASLGDRLRMVSPYREDVAQAFARYFMRVALPIDPVEFDEWDPPE